ncbi:MAG: hypothetical protein ACRD6X_22515, partial [Pyrinomonadaceae bacterium]
MTFRLYLVLIFAFIVCLQSTLLAQTDTFVGQITDSANESFAGSISGDGRFVVFESTGNLATENPRNEDGNVEIF